MRGAFITFEGPEGSGKSTQAQHLISRLQSEGYDVVSAREPGGTRTGEMIREILQHDAAGEMLFAETEVLLFAASRAQLVRSIIEPALQRGACVVCDRFADSTTVYQGHARGLDIETMLSMNAFAVGPTVPDLTILLDIDVATGFERLRRRHEADHTARDRIESESMEFHERVREGYLRLADRCPDRFETIRTDRDASIVREEIWQIAQRVLPGAPRAGKAKEGHSES